MKKMRNNTLTSIILGVISIFILPLVAGADSVPWTTQTYSAIAWAGECCTWDGTGKLNTVVGPLFPASATSFSNPPVTKKPNKIFMVKDIVKNQGSADAGQFTIGYYLSKYQIRSDDDIYLAGNRNISTLGINTSSDENGVKPVKVKIPSNTPPGRYYVIACADNMNEIAESDETNNCKVSKKRIRVRR
jgi:hypothetical protein